MSLPVMKPERRRTPRIRPEGLAYINFEPDNGGIVLDISEDGLCFQAAAPVQPEEVIHFWFSAEGSRIAAHGRLAWIDDKRKTGGLRFNALSPEARRQIRIWITQSTMPFAAERKLATAVPSVLPPASAPDARTRSSARTIAAFGQAAWNLFSQWRRARFRWTEFSRGLAAGLLVSLLVVGAFLFHMHRRKVGELLIRIGERFGATVQQQALPAIPVREATVQQRRIVSEPTPQSARRPRNALSQPLTRPVRFPLSKPNAQAPPPVMPSTSSMGSLPMTAPSVGLPISVELAKGGRPESSVHADGEPKLIEPKNTDSLGEDSEAIAELNSGIPLGKYFEIGRFRDEMQAHKTIENLAGVSSHAIIVPKSILWMTSYQVLVGPYGNEAEARSARKDLQSRGFKTRSLPRRSREFTLPSVTKSYGGADTSENFVVSWEAYSADATVKFVRGSDTVASAKGRWMKRATKYESDGVMYDKHQDGSRMLLEIWFRGMSQALVFRSTLSDHSIIF
jgi:PilZ domain/SPOR domain